MCIRDSVSTNNPALTHRDTERIICKWDDENNILHYAVIYSSTDDKGVRYNRLTMTPGDTGADDTWTGRGVNTFKHIIHSNFVNALDNDTTSGTDFDNYQLTNNWPNQIDRFSMGLDKRGSFPRLWVSFPYSSDNTNIGIYANCSTNADMTDWVANDGSSNWPTSTTEADSVIGDYITLVSDTGHDIKTGTGENQIIADDCNAKFVDGTTGGVAFIGLAYTAVATGEKWRYIERSNAANPTAGAGGGFGSAEHIYGSDTAEPNGHSHHLSIKAYQPAGSNTSNLVFCGKTNDHKIRISERTGGTWTSTVTSGATQYGYPNPVVDPVTNNIFIFALKDYNLGGTVVSGDVYASTYKVDMLIVNKSNLSSYVQDWTTVIEDDSSRSVLAPITGHSDVSTNSKIMVMALTIKQENLATYYTMGSASAISGDLRFGYNVINQSNFTVPVDDEGIQTITLTSPQAGDVVTVGESVTITWTTT